MGWFSTLTGYGMVKRSVKSAFVDPAVRTADLGKALVKSGAGGPRKMQNPPADHYERFRAAFDFYDRDYRYLENAVRRTYQQFWFYAVFSLGYIALQVSLIGPGWSLFEVIWRMAPLAIILALTLRCASTNWWFREGHLKPLHVYLRSPSAWLPHKEPGPVVTYFEVTHGEKAKVIDLPKTKPTRVQNAVTR